MAFLKKGVMMMFLLFGLILLAVIFMTFSTNNKDRNGSDATEILEKKFAKGEIEKEEFESKLEVLQSRKKTLGSKNLIWVLPIGFIFVLLVVMSHSGMGYHKGYYFNNERMTSNEYMMPGFDNRMIGPGYHRQNNQITQRPCLYQKDGGFPQKQREYTRYGEPNFDRYNERMIDQRFGEGRNGVMENFQGDRETLRKEMQKYFNYGN